MSDCPKCGTSDLVEPYSKCGVAMWSCRRCKNCWEDVTAEQMSAKYGPSDPLNPVQVAKMFGVCPRTVYNWRRNKKNPLPSYTVPGSNRFYCFKNEIVEWVKSND